MEGQPCGTIRVSKIRRIHHRITEELGAGYKVNRRSTKEYKEAFQQEKTKSSRIESWRQRVVGKQKYPIELTLKEVQLELPERWAIYNVFNKDLLT